MRDPKGLGRLRDDELLAAVARLVAQDRALTADLLAHLGELDERGTCIERGFSSLFAYCTRQLGFCNSSAWLRVASARVCRRFPVALELVASGALNVSVLAALAPRLNQDNAAELFEGCGFQSIRHVEEMLAARFPKPDQRDSIRRLPTRAETIAPCAGSIDDTRASAAGASAVGFAASRTCASDDERQGGLHQPNEGRAPEGASPPDEQPSLRRARDERPARKLEPLSAGRFGVRFTADTEFRDLVEEVRALASYRHPDGDLLSLMRAGLEAYRRELQRARFKVGKKVRAKATAAAARVRQRSRSAANDVVGSSAAAGMPERRLTRGASGFYYRQRFAKRETCSRGPLRPAGLNPKILQSHASASE